MPAITKEIKVNATLEDTWALVGDMEKFSACIPGCREVKKKSESDFDWVIDAKVMRTTRTLKATTTIKDQRAPFHASFIGNGRLFERSNHYKIQIEGNTDLTKLSELQTLIVFSGKVHAKGTGGALIDKIVSSQMEPLFKEFQKNIKTSLGDTETGIDVVQDEESSQKVPARSKVPLRGRHHTMWLWAAGVVAAATLVVAYFAFA